MTTYANLRIGACIVACLVATKLARAGPIQLASNTWRLAESATPRAVAEPHPRVPEAPGALGVADRLAHQPALHANIITVTSEGNDLPTAPSKIPTGLPTTAFPEELDLTTKEPFVIIASETSIEPKNIEVNTYHTMEQFDLTEAINIGTTMVAEESKTDLVIGKAIGINQIDSQQSTIQSTTSQTPELTTFSTTTEIIHTSPTAERPLVSTSEIKTTVMIESSTFAQRSTFKALEMSTSTAPPSTEPAATTPVTLTPEVSTLESTMPASTIVASTEAASTTVASIEAARTTVASTEAARTTVASTEAASTTVASTEAASTTVASTTPAPSFLATTGAASSTDTGTESASITVASTIPTSTTLADTESGSTTLTMTTTTQASTTAATASSTGASTTGANSPPASVTTAEISPTTTATDEPTTTAPPSTAASEVHWSTTTAAPEQDTTKHFQDTTRLLMTTTPEVSQFETLPGLDANNYKVKALNMNAENAPVNETTNELFSKKMIAEMLHSSSQLQTDNDKYQRSLSSTDQINKTPVEDKITTNQNPLNVLFAKYHTDADNKEGKVVENNEISKVQTTYLPIRKQYTAIERKWPHPTTGTGQPARQGKVTEALTKASKKHLNVWVADLKLSDDEMGFTSISRNPTSTMFPTMTSPTTTAAGMVSRRAGYLNNSPSTITETELPASTNSARASNSSLIGIFPAQSSVLYLNTTYSSLTPSTVLHRELPNQSTSPVPFTKKTVNPYESKIQQLTPSIDFNKSRIAPKNITEDLPVYVETDVLPLSPSTSQHLQLVDDAIKEEFMKEMALNLNKKLANLNKLSDDSLDDDDPATSPASAANVSERARNLTLYKVNPNYKPLKRLEIQPSKQFTIDPDDNSWRNESINSRGIVFKAKNSSIVFTQVLKNKTESELNNGKLFIKDNKEEVPELRERLEKIAEKRKLKKKYNTTSVEVGISTTTVSSQEENGQTKYIMLQDEKAKHLDSVVTDASPFHKTEDVYDGHEEEEDDDEQFLKLTHRDILRESITPKEPASTYFPPNRKGTVQYFPPRMNDQINYKVDFFATANSFPFPKPSTDRPATKITETFKVPKSFEPTDPKLRRESMTEIPPHGPFVVKHYRDFLRQAADDVPDERKPVEHLMPKAEVIKKIVEDFNKNSDHLKAEFPMVYNSSVSHGGGSASLAWLRRLQDAPRPGTYLHQTKSYDVSCENLTVELNPAYELHFYVPEQEESQDPPLPEPFHHDTFQV